MRYYFALVGIACVIASLVLFVRRLAFVRLGIRAVGTVVGFESRDSDAAVMHAPRIEFHDEQGRKHTFSTEAGMALRKPAMGSQVIIIYAPGTPYHAYLDSFFHLWAKPLVCFVIGAVALLVYAAG